MIRASILTLLLSAHSALAAETQLAAAVRNGDLSSAQQALAAGADIDARTGPFRMTALSLAAVRGDTSMLQFLLSEGANPNARTHRGMTALSVAARSCRAGPAVFDALIAAGADLEDRSGAGLTPLMAAIQEERTALALQLMAAGADVNTLNQYGDGVLNYAIYTKNPMIVRAALARGVETRQLERLFTTGIYYYPGFGARRPHATGCS